MSAPSARPSASRAAPPMAIDRYLPAFDVTTVRHAVVDADPETTYEAMLAADLLDTGPGVRALVRLRNAPRALVDLARGETGEPAPARVRFADVAASDEWTVLDEVPGEELVIGAVGRFWRPSIAWRSVDRDAFAAFDEPGYAKLAISLSVRPYGEARTLLSYEARTATTDEPARRRFRRYWRVVGPFAGYLMTRALDRIRADAEERARRERAASTAAGGVGRHLAERADGRLAALAGLALAGAYHLLVRPWHRRWGASAWEARGSLPGDDLLPEATEQVTHAVDVAAPAEAVWPWLVQIGQGRGGFYSYDWLENAVGADIHNVDRILPEYQDLEVGDVVRLAPEDYPIQSPESAPEVALLEPERALVLRPPGETPAWTWAFVLRPVDASTTRLLARMRSVPGRTTLGPAAGRPRLARAVDYLVWEPAHFVMERKLLLGVKERAERAVSAEAPATGDAAPVDGSTPTEEPPSTDEPPATE